MNKAFVGIVVTVLVIFTVGGFHFLMTKNRKASIVMAINYASESAYVPFLQIKMFSFCNRNDCFVLKLYCSFIRKCIVFIRNILFLHRNINF